MLNPTKEEISAAFEWLRAIAIASSMQPNHAANALHEWHRLAQQYEPKETSDGTRLVLQAVGGTKTEAIACAIRVIGNAVQNPDTANNSISSRSGSAEARWV